MYRLVKALKPMVLRSQFLSRLYRLWRDDRDFKRTPTKSAFGFLFSGNESMETGRFEPVETRFIVDLLTEVSVVVNVGANIGYYCCLALQEGKRVVAFEPVVSNQKLLFRNVMLNGWANSFECYSMALAEKPGLVQIYGGGTGASLIKGWAGQQHSTLTPVSTLDIVLGGRFLDDKLLIIVDVEGAEFAMLKGANRFLSSLNPPIWFVEIAVGEHQPEGIEINPNLVCTFELFYHHGYTAISVDEPPRIVQFDEVKNIVATAIDTLKTHNFVFVKGFEHVLGLRLPE